MNEGGGSVRVVLFALAANLGIAASKFIGALISGSASLMAEAIHSLVDSANQILLLIGNRKARKPPDQHYPLGHGREAFFWSFIVAIMLFSLGGLLAIYEGIDKLKHPHQLESPLLGVSILAVGFILEAFSFHACLREIRRRYPKGNLIGWFHRTTSSELLVVFTEDSAAMLGLTIAGVCLAAAWLTGDPAWDARGSILVGCLLVVVALFLAIEIKSLLIGEAPAKDIRSVIERLVAEKIPGGCVLELIAIQTGNREIMVSYKVEPGTLTDVRELVAVLNEIEREVKRAIPEIKWQFVEPDDKR